MIKGKGIFLWQIWDCEKGDVDRIVHAALAARFSHVIVKVAEGSQRYNHHPTTRVDLAPALVSALQGAGIQVWGFHYVYSQDPLGEARIGAQRVRELRLDGYVIDAEAEYKRRTLAAERYLAELRKHMPAGVPVALSSYRFPSYHPEFPWQTFLRGVDLLMPQVYWMKATNAGVQLARSQHELNDLCVEVGVDLPIIPTGAAFHERGWTAQPGEIADFAATARKMGMPAFNFWEWGNARRYGLFEVVAALEGGSSPLPAPEPQLRGLNMEVTATTLFIRRGPGQSYQTIGSLPAETPVEILDVAGQNAWCKIRVGGKEGWICAQLGGQRFLEAHPEEDPDA